MEPNAMIGKQIANYQITEKLGEGGMGVVYKGMDSNLGRPVAIKMLSAQLAHDPEIVERFRAEARAQANLSHANLAVLYAFLVEDGTAFMVMEFVEGQTFEQMIRARGPIPVETALPLFKQALMGVGAAHRVGIVHRDIKPSNIMLNTAGVVKVMDFGIAKVVGTRGMTRTGMQLGTPAYMAPEQIQNKPIDTRTDIYALGITLYQMLSGQLPFQHESDFETMNSHVAATPPPMKQMFAYAPIQYQNVVMKALEKDPNYRFQTVEEFSAALDNPESVPEPGSAATVVPVGVVRTVVASGIAAPAVGRTVIEGSAAATASAPTIAKTVMQPGVAPTVMASSAGSPAAAQAPVVAKKGGWNSGHTFAVCAVAAVAIILAVVSFGKKGPVETAAQVNAPSASSAQGSPLGAQQVAAPAPAASVPDDLMKSASASDPSTASPVPGGSAPSAPMKPVASVKTSAGGGVAISAPGAKVTVSPNGAVQVSAPGASVSVPAQDAPPVMPAMSQQEVDELEHRIDQLSARAAAINNSLDRMQKQQAASGYGLRGDMVAAQASMKLNLQKAQSSMEHNDPVKAKKYADVATANAETLEQFLGR